MEDIIQYLQDGKAPDDLSEKRKKILAMKATPYTLINGSLYNLGQDDVLRRCVLPHDRQAIINEVHARAVGIIFQVDAPINKILQAGLWWPTLNRDCKSQLQKCINAKGWEDPLSTIKCP